MKEMLPPAAGIGSNGDRDRALPKRSDSSEQMTQSGESQAQADGEKRASSGTGWRKGVGPKFPSGI